MQLIEFRNNFKESILNLYGEEETRSFFYLLAEAYLKLSKAEIALNLQRQLTDKEILLFEKALRRLQAEEPIQYIIGKTEFYGLPFKVNPTVLIPRPETEELVDLIIQENKEKKISILDIGTGSGCIAISLAKYLPQAHIFGLDISEKALHTAQENAIANQVKVEFFMADILKVRQLPQQFDVIVSNPPYVRESEKMQMHNNVLKNEPHSALFVPNNDPLLFYEKIASLAKGYLNSGGELYFEINEGYGNEVMTMLKKKGFEQVVLRKDIFGKDRMVKGISK